MIGLILAAGKGSRIANVTEGLPKSFLKIRGKKIIDHQLEAMRAAGIERCVVVVGYRSELFAEQFGSDHAITLIVNPFYSRCNVLGSVWCARNHLSEGFVFAHADTYFEPSILDDLVAHPGDMVFAIEKKPSLPEEMKVKVSNGVITVISKEMACETAYGEFTGIARFSATAGPTVKRAVEHRIERLQALDDYFEAVVQDLIDAGESAHIMDIGERISVEIDFPEDYERARRLEGDL